MFIVDSGATSRMINSEENKMNLKDAKHESLQETVEHLPG